MANLFSGLGLEDTDFVFRSTVGQDVIYQVAADWVADRNADLQAATSAFISGMTEDFKARYRLPGGGFLQRRDEKGRFNNVKVTGKWDVGFPLEDFGAAIGGDDVANAYMTAEELSLHVSTVVSQNVNTVRFELLRRLLNNTQRSFTDKIRGTILVEPLANGDTVVYPPVLGSNTEATDDHYLESNYAASAISDTNDPYSTIANELTEHFGAVAGNSNIAVFINNAQAGVTRDLSEFVAFTDMGVIPGDDTATVANMNADGTLPGRVLGRMQDSGVWVMEWRHVPALYMIGIDVDAEAPLKMRVDPAAVGLGQGLQLVGIDEQFPYSNANWRNRFGIGAANRLNGVVMELGVGGTYTIPTGFTY